MVAMKTREISERAREIGDKEAHLEALGDVAGIEVFHNLVLVMTHIESDKTAGGIIKPDRSLDESRFQGKAALVIALGPQAFRDDDAVRFGGASVEVGDWVLVRPSDGLEFCKVDASGRVGCSCRLFADVNIKAKLSDPTLVW